MVSPASSFSSSVLYSYLIIKEEIKKTKKLTLTVVKVLIKIYKRGIINEPKMLSVDPRI